MTNLISALRDILSTESDEQGILKSIQLIHNSNSDFSTSIAHDYLQSHFNHYCKHIPPYFSLTIEDEHTDEDLFCGTFYEVSGLSGGEQNQAEDEVFHKVVLKLGTLHEPHSWMPILTHPRDCVVSINLIDLIGKVVCSWSYRFLCEG